MPIAYVINGENGDDVRVKLNSVIDIANAAVLTNAPITSLSETLNYKIFTATERTRLSTTLLAADVGVTVAPFIKHIYDGVRAPDVNDDASSGFVAGSTWIYGLTTYKCFNAAEGNAVWGLTSLTSADLGSAAFTNSSDYAPAAQGIAGGNLHDHSGGDGGQISYNNLADLPTLVTGGNSHNHASGDGGQIAYSSLSGLPALDYAPFNMGVTNGNSHSHSNGDGDQISYNSLANLPTLGTAAATDATDYAPAAQGVINGNSHNHDGGDGGQIAYASLSGLPTFGSAAWTPVSNYATSAMGVTGGNLHDHSGGDGGQISYNSLANLPTLGTAAATASTDYAPAAQGVTNGNSHNHDGGDGGKIAYASLSGLPTLPSGAIVGSTDTQTLSAKTLVDPIITGAIKETVYTIMDAIGFEIDPSNGSIQLITLTASRTPKATNFVAGESVLLMVLDGAAYTLTWTSTTFGAVGVKWIGGIAPSLDTTKYTCLKLWKVGTQVYGRNLGAVVV